MALYLMKRLLDKIRTGTFVALALCVVLLVFMAMVIPNGETMWADKQWAADQIGDAKTPDQLKQMLQFAASSVSAGQHTWRGCLYTFMFANIAMIGFLSRHLFLIRRLQRAVSNDQKT
jgi:hypothetical protein